MSGENLEGFAEGYEAGMVDERARVRREEVAPLVEALRFYADTRRYQGSNQRVREGDDPFTPPSSPYLIDCFRDSGAIARAALAAAEARGSDSMHDYEGASDGLADAIKAAEARKE